MAVVKERAINAYDLGGLGFWVRESEVDQRFVL